MIRAVVPIADAGVQARQALAFARAIAPDDRHVVAVHVTDEVASRRAPAAGMGGMGAGEWSW